jgi:hypothetical protein
MSKHERYTKEQLEEAAKQSISVREVMIRLGIKLNGGSHSHISRRLRHYNVDTSHFLGQRWHSGGHDPKRKSWEQVLVKSNGVDREETFRLRRCLLEYGREHKCEKCGQLPEWNGFPLILQIDHVNRDFTDNTPGNLRFLCPNCHTQTDGYNGSKRHLKVKTSERIKPIKPKAVDGNQKILCPKCKSSLKNKKSKVCKKCHIERLQQIPRQRKVKNRPDKDVLIKEVKEFGYCEVGRRYGVSDNAVRKWLK